MKADVLVSRTAAAAAGPLPGHRGGADVVRADTVVVGAGPAGLFAALRASGAGHTTLLLDAGQDLAERVASREGGTDSSAVITSGFGGAGLFSDGKLCLSHRIGSTVSSRFTPAEVERRQRRIDARIRSGEWAPLGTTDPQAVGDLQRAAGEAGMEYVHYPVRHVGSDQLPGMLRRLRARLAHHVQVVCGTSCVDVRPSGRSGHPWELAVEGRLSGLLWARHVVLAPGKLGARWLDTLAGRIGLEREQPTAKVGLRLEGPKSLFDRLLAVAGDPKLIWTQPEGAQVRTHCVCHGGDVVPARYGDLVLVGGHSESGHAADRSNCAVIATAGSRFPLGAGGAGALVRAANRMAGGLPVAQSLGGFLDGSADLGHPARRAEGFEPSLPGAAPGNLADCYPAPIVALLRAFIDRLAALCPQARLPGNLVYGPAAERLASRFAVNDEMEGLPGLFLTGDGPGLTGGIIGAAESGWIAGDAIAARLRAMTAKAARA